MSRSASTSWAMLSVLLCVCCSAETSVVEPDSSCNGHEQLCELRFDEVAYPMTHNAMSNAEAGWISPNQNHGITRQLDDGIRGLMLDTYDEDGDLLRSAIRSVSRAVSRCSMASEKSRPPRREPRRSGVDHLRELHHPRANRPDFAEMVNYNPLFIERALQCQDERNALPNFVTVDFYDIGDLFEVVNALNGL